MELDPRTTALGIARGRVGIGLAMMAVPGVVARVTFGGNTGQARAILRMLGAREVVLGIGSITALKEQNQDAEWVGMSAVADGTDVIAFLLAPGPPARRIINAATAASAAVTGILCARQIADERAVLELEAAEAVESEIDS